MIDTYLHKRKIFFRILSEVTALVRRNNENIFHISCDFYEASDGTMERQRILQILNKMLYTVVLKRVPTNSVRK
jgi:hypothetical protein